jgi:peptide-methionine (S)-S-oxide reductase
MNKIILVAALATAVAAWTFLGPGLAAEPVVALPAPAVDAPASTSPTETAVFAGGCFWGVQAVFQHTNGVLSAVSGYAGGDKASANYQMVSGGGTRHAEAVQVTYDPKQISYGTLMQIFFSVAHDPTQLNRQGPDMGPQYRSAVFYKNGTQKELTEKYIAQLEAAKAFPRKIVTEVAPLTDFFVAEAYHQDYATLNPNQPYIAIHDRPKIANLKTMMPQLYREKPVLVSPPAKG